MRGAPASGLRGGLRGLFASHVIQNVRLFFLCESCGHKKQRGPRAARARARRGRRTGRGRRAPIGRAPRSPAYITYYSRSPAPARAPRTPSADLSRVPARFDTTENALVTKRARRGSDVFVVCTTTSVNNKFFTRN